MIKYFSTKRREGVFAFTVAVVAALRGMTMVIYIYIYIYIYYYQCTTTFVTLPRGLDRYVSPIMKARIDYS